MPSSKPPQLREIIEGLSLSPEEIERLKKESKKAIKATKNIDPQYRKKRLQKKYGARKATSMTAQESIQATANASRYFFRTPKPIYFALPILLTSILYGILIEYMESGALSRTSIHYGVVLFLLPAVSSVFITTLFDRILGGRLYLRRSTFLCFLVLGAMGPVLFIYLFAGKQLDMELYVTLLFVYSFIIWMRHLFIVTTCNNRHYKAFFPTMVQPILGFISVYSVFPPESPRMFWMVAGLFSLIFLVTIIWFLEITKAPLLSNFNADLWENVGHAIAHLTERGRSGVEGLEHFFSSFSEPMDVFIAIVGFRAKGKEKGEGEDRVSKESDAGRPLKALVIIPSIHPGPFGIVGGGDLTRKVGSKLQSTADNIFMFHGTATHDMNIAASPETAKIAATVKRLVKGLTFSERAGRFTRVSRGFHICTQFFGDGAVSTYTSAPEPSDDLHYSIGFMSYLESKRMGASDAVLIDAHNCLVPGAGTVFFGSRRSYDILDGLGDNIARARNSVTEGIAIGTAQDSGFSVDEGLGEAGVQALMIDAGGQRTAYVLYDGNNMVAGLREKIIDAISDLADEAEVFTSDNHRVNVNLGGYCPVGLQKSAEEIIERTRKTVERAIEDIEPVSAGMKSGRVKGLRVFGAENTARLTSIINASTSVLVKSALATITIAVLGCTVVMMLLP